MPRRAKPQSPQAAAGQAYGERQATIEAQQAMPLPNMQQANAAPMPAAAQGQELLHTARSANLPMPGGMAAPTTRPDEPITAGMSRGAGPGPEVLPTVKRSESDYARMLRLMTRATGDPSWANQAARMRRG